MNNINLLIRYSIFFAFITTFLNNRFSKNFKNNKIISILNFNSIEISLIIMLLIYLLSFIDYNDIHNDIYNNIYNNIPLFPTIIEGKKNRKKKKKKKKKKRKKKQEKESKELISSRKMLSSFKTMDSPPNKLDIEQLNTAMKNANEAVSCGVGTECFREKKIESLKGEYINAKKNVEVAPEELSDARKEYYVYSFSEDYYKEKEGEILSQEGNKKLDEIKEHNESEFNQLDAMNNSYLNLFNYIQSLKNLFNKISSENNELKEKIQEKIDTAFTTKRKVYYEDIEIEKNEFYIKLLRMFYFIFIFSYILLSIYYKEFKRNNLIFMFLLIIFPYISTYIMSYLLKQIHYLTSKLPK